MVVAVNADNWIMRQDVMKKSRARKNVTKRMINSGESNLLVRNTDFCKRQNYNIFCVVVNPTIEIL